MYLYILVSLVLALIFAFSCHTAIRRHPGMFYGIAFFLVLFEVIYYQFGIHDIAPQWFTAYIVNPFKCGAFSTALFIIVMYLGALDSKHLFVRKLMGIRGQLSILACILTLGHNIIYGKKHFVNLFTNPWAMKPQTMLAAVLSILMICIMLPLMMTSFPSVRRKISAGSWKRLQRLAYLFFALTYIHVMVLFIPNWEKKIPDIIAYTVIFGTYLILRITKQPKSLLTHWDMLVVTPLPNPARFPYAQEGRPQQSGRPSSLFSVVQNGFQLRLLLSSATPMVAISSRVGFDLGLAMVIPPFPSSTPSKIPAWIAVSM